MSYSILSIKPECSGTIPCLHECQVQEIETQKTMNVILDGDSIRSYFREGLGNWTKEHFLRPFPFKLEDVTWIEIGKCTQDGSYCFHPCKISLKGGKKKSFYLLNPMILKIYESIGVFDGLNMLFGHWSKAHFQSSQLSAKQCTIL